MTMNTKLKGLALMLLSILICLVVIMFTIPWNGIAWLIPVAASMLGVTGFLIVLYDAKKDIDDK